MTMQMINAATIGRFHSEEVSSVSGYVSGYEQPKTIETQLDQIYRLFPNTGRLDRSFLRGKHPIGSEGWFAIPQWNVVASTYHKATAIVLEKLADAYPGCFENYCGELLTGQNTLRQSARSATAWKKIRQLQKGCNIALVPAQLGLCYRGRSVRRARELFDANEFGLGLFATGVILLTHPERLAQHEDLWIDCSGDEVSRNGDGAFSCVPVIRRYNDQLEVDCRSIDFAGSTYATASAFVL